MFKLAVLMAAVGYVMALTAVRAEQPAAGGGAEGSGGAGRAPLKTAFTPEPIEIDPAVGTRVLKWKDGKRVAFYLAFDDACPTDLTNVIPELNKRKMVGTFYVIGNTIKGKQAWVEAAKSPYIILANHTLTHKDFPTIEKFESEVIATNEIVLKTQAGDANRLLSFGKPGGVKYGITEEQIEQVLAKHNLIYRLPFYGYTAPITGIDNVDAYVDKAIIKGDISHLDFHGVGGDWLVVPLDVFHAFLDKLDANRDAMWISDAATLQKYAAERKSAEVKVIEKGETQIRLTLTAKTDPKQYDEPLTLATRVPAGWKSAVVAQGETKMTVPCFDSIAKYEVLPNGVEILLTAAQ